MIRGGSKRFQTHFKPTVAPTSGTVPPPQWPLLTCSVQNLDPGGLGVRAVVEANGVAHLVAQQGSSLLGHPSGHLSSADGTETCEKEAVAPPGGSWMTLVTAYSPRWRPHGEAASRQSPSPQRPSRPPGGTARGGGEEESRRAEKVTGTV